jgi:hypothetical protein
MSETYNVDRLFRVTLQREFAVRGQKKKLWLRTLGTAANAYREQYAVGKARLLLARIKHEGTSEHETYMLLPHEEARDELIARALMMNMRHLTSEVAREVTPHESLEAPEFPTLTEVVEAEEGEDIAHAETVAEINEVVKGRLQLYEEELQAMDDIDLIEEVVRLVIEGALSAEFNRASNAATLFHGVYTDKDFTKRFFISPEEVTEGDPSFIEQLLTAYAEIDVFASAPDELKK